MERPESRSSGLPRVSKLPQTRLARPAPISTLTNAESQAGTDPPSRQARSNTMELRQPSGIKAATTTPIANNRRSMLMKPGFQAAIPKDIQPEDHRPLQSPTSPMSPESQTSDDTSLSGSDSRFAAPAVFQSTKPRRSLSDRTVESLAQIPPSPSSSRRMSAFYGNPSESPMRPPSRTGSSLGYRPGSRVGGTYSGIRQPDRPESPSKRPVSMATGLARPGSIALPKKSTNTTLPSSKSSTGLQQPSKIQSKIGGRGMTPIKTGAPTPGTGSKLGAPRTTGIKPPAKSPSKETFGGPLKLPSPQKSLGNMSKPMQPPRKLSVPKVSLRPGHKTSASVGSSRDGASSPEKPVGSLGLRDTIAQAKATHRKQNSAFVPRGAAAQSNFLDVGPDADPNLLDVMDSVHINILKKRIHTAQTEGTLNISALCLTEIPSEVLRMYEYDPDDKSSMPWYERVDVTRLLAGDNEMKELPRELFPARRSDDQDEDDQSLPDREQDSQSLAGPFPNLERLDLRGNQLLNLPDTIRNSVSLHSIDVTRNKLSGGVWDVLVQVRSCKDLKLGKNQLNGAIPDDIALLADLEHLVAPDNQIEEVPSSLGKLAKLKELNLAGNRLQDMPFEPIFDIGITTIDLSHNRLNGSLFPKTVPSFNTLVHLNVSHNALTYVAEGGISLPNLKTLDISNNRIIELPTMTAWTKLESLLAEENKISAFPEGFTKCTSLRTVNLNNNSLLMLEDDIGSMDNLVSLHIEQNPLRERKLMRMNTEEIKAELRSRKAAEANTSSPRRFGAGESSPTSPNTSSWTVSNGTIDRSTTRMITIDEATVQSVADKNVTSLILHHNSLQTISPAIELLGSTLVTLDLANNKLGRTELYLSGQLCLPNLQTLNLTSNALTSLAPLTANLSAARLATLTLPFNRLTTLPSDLCTAFPGLRKLMVNNNKLVTLDVTAVKGLEVLEISGNDVEALPPELGLLQGQLRMLMVGGNKFRVPGWGIIEKGTDAILGWCKNRLPEDATLEGLNATGDKKEPETNVTEA